MNEDYLEQFLSHYLSIFGIDKVELTHFFEHKITGYACYAEEFEKQKFCWQVTYRIEDLGNVIELIKIMKDNNVFQGDKINISREEIFKATKWSDREKFLKTYNTLLEIEVKMIDEDEETDSFFVHE